MTSIITWLKSIESDFYDAYLEVLGWIYPFWWLAFPLLYASRGFGWLAYYFGEFDTWLYWANERISEILSWSAIWSSIKTVFPKIEELRDWFYDWWGWIKPKVVEWWAEVSIAVKGWIAIATEGLANLEVAWSDFSNITWPQWTGRLDKLTGEWGDFLTQKLPTLFDISYAEVWWRGKFLDVTKAIDTALTAWTPLLESWQVWRDKVAEFFADPEDWLYKSLDRIVERFW